MAESLEPNTPPAWHALEMDLVLNRLSTTLDGLDQDEAKKRIATYGPNVLSATKGTPVWKRFAQQFNNVLIYVLMGAGVVTALMKHWADTSVIFGVVVVNAIIGFIQEGKAEKAMDAIRNMLSPQATVLRGGRRMTIDASGLVPGDVVFVQSGDRIPADIRLARVKNLQVQEAALTGESLPVEKSHAQTRTNTALADRQCMVFAGTLVTTGQGTGVVVATAGHTEIGHISAILADVRTLETPLLRQMAQFSKWLTGGILVIAGLTFAFGVLARDYSAVEMFIAAVGLSVAAIPEGLPAIMTITLAIGVQRMAGRNAIIRKLPAVETLGSVTVICSDKTGTLTRNEMTTQSIATSRNLYTVTGEGYSPMGTFFLGEDEVDLEQRPLLRDMARAALLCSDAQVNRKPDGTLSVDGDPTEGALVVLAEKAGLDLSFETKTYPRTDVIPFESEHQFMASLHHDHEGNGYIFVKGAPERILDMCEQQHDYGKNVPLDEDYWHRRMEEISSRGQRVLALAQRHTEATHRELLFSDITSGLVLTGLIGLADPPRAEAISAVALCQKAGISVKMITGDHSGTATAIGREIGLVNPEKVLRGVEIDTLDDTELARRVPDVNVFARTTPEHKLRLVTALQANGEVVSMTGDGVNDAPALKRADVGVAMGKNGTEAAKEAAEMVLADDNFSSISSAIEEGRTVYDNLIKAITFILPTNGAEALVIIAAIALGYSLPITPLQILWVNMTTAVTLALALAFEPPETEVMTRPPRDPRMPIMSRFLIWRIVFVSIICVLGTFGLFQWELQQGTSLEAARSITVNTLVLFEVFYLFNTRYLFASTINLHGLFGNRVALLAVLIVMILQMGFVYLEPMQVLFETTAIDAMAWLRSAIVASMVFFLVEMEKWVVNHFIPAPHKRRNKSLSGTDA